MVYPPQEDSFMLEIQIKNYLGKFSKEQKEKLKVLDMGSGSGIQARTAIASGIKRINLIASDIEAEAIKKLKEQKIPARKSNLYSNINKEKKFDLIIFNAPYLPANKYDSKPDTTAGKKGYEIILKFLRKSKKYLTKEGVILILFSSLSIPEKILAYTKKLGYSSHLLDEKEMGMFEKLYVYKLAI
jgi:HemK-related putative methylase